MKPSETSFAAEITPATTLYKEIKDAVAKFKPRSILEIGSANGRGSTQAFINSVYASLDMYPKMACLEIVQERYDELVGTIAAYQYNWITPIHASSVPVGQYMNDLDIKDFFDNPETEDMNVRNFGEMVVRSWRQGELVNIINNDIPQNGIAQAKKLFGGVPDMVLIDGSCFSGHAELEAVLGAKVIILDDIMGIKNWKGYRQLQLDKNYLLVRENLTERNGYAIFVRIDDAKTTDKS